MVGQYRESVLSTCAYLVAIAKHVVGGEYPLALASAIRNRFASGAFRRFIAENGIRVERDADARAQAAIGSHGVEQPAREEDTLARGRGKPDTGARVMQFRQAVSKIPGPACVVNTLVGHTIAMLLSEPELTILPGAPCLPIPQHR